MDLRALVNRIGEADASGMSLTFREIQGKGSDARYEIEDARVATVRSEDEQCEQCDGSGEMPDGANCEECDGTGEGWVQSLVITLTHAGYAPEIGGAPSIDFELASEQDDTTNPKEHTP
jgi:hypothetical protein